MVSYYNPDDFGAIADNTTDSYPAFQACYNQALLDGKNIELSGNANGDKYMLSQPWNIAYSGTAYLNPSIKIYGSGVDRTVLAPLNPNQAVINLPQNNTFTFQRNGGLYDFSIDGGNLTNGEGIVAQSLFNWDFESLVIRNFTKNGMRIINQAVPGDYDASNNLWFKHVRIENCDNWGILIDAAAANNETSFINMNNCFIHKCGTDGWIGGGMYWKGQCLQMNSCAFTMNQNSGLWVPGGAGLSSNLSTFNTVFENNYKRHITIRGLKNADFHSLQLYSNDTYRTDYGVYLNPDNTVIANIKVHSCKLRATAGNSPHYAFAGFNLGTNAATCQVVNAQLNRDNYGYAGQNTNIGWTFI